jgi:hypothetical protein
MRDVPIAIAPFYAESLQPEAYAAFWQQVLAPNAIDVLMLQDGAGARGTALARVETLLRALGPVLERKRVALWSVVELFDQTSGPPRNSGPFAAGPTPFEQLEARMRVERPWVSTAVGFTILDYMAPERGAEAAQLYQRYAQFCRR